MTSVIMRWVDEAGVVQTRTAEDTRGLPTTDGPAWVDVTAPTEQLMQSLAERFGLHALGVEDALHPQRRPKVDVYPDGLFLAWLAPYALDQDSVKSEEVDAFLGKGYLVTVHDRPNHCIDEAARDADRRLAQGPDWILHSIIDRLVDDAMPLVDTLGERLASIEDVMLEDSPRQAELRDLHRVRRQLVRMHRIVAPERDILRSFARESEVVGPDAYRYFQDVGDHVARLLDGIETYQDVGASVMDVYLSAQSNRMNEIMKQLTVVATIFMPLTLISGIYGMNVLAGMWPPPLAPWSFAAVVASMVVIAVAMALYFRKRKWW